MAQPPNTQNRKMLTYDMTKSEKDRVKQSLAALQGVGGQYEKLRALRQPGTNHLLRSIEQERVKRERVLGQSFKIIKQMEKDASRLIANTVRPFEKAQNNIVTFPTFGGRGERYNLLPKGAPHGKTEV